jgi:hypothetical protein
VKNKRDYVAVLKNAVHLTVAEYVKRIYMGVFSHVFVYVNVGHFKVQYSSCLLLNITVHKRVHGIQKVEEYYQIVRTHCEMQHFLVILIAVPCILKSKVSHSPTDALFITL